MHTRDHTRWSWSINKLEEVKVWMVLTRSISVKSWLRLREKMSWSFCIPDCTCVTYDRQLCKASSGSHSSISVRHWISQITFFHRNGEIMILKTSQPTLILLLQLEFFLLALLCGKKSCLDLVWNYQGKKNTPSVLAVQNYQAGHK